MADIKRENGGKLTKEDAIGQVPFEIKEGIAFCIELTDTIFLTDKDLGHSQFEEILIALADTMASLAITLPNTGIGCYLFNVDGEPDGIKKLVELKDLNAPDTKAVFDILDDNSSGRQTFAKRFPVAKTQKTPVFKVLSVIQDDMLYAKSKFKSKPYNNKKIFLFTDNDKPYGKDYKAQLSLKKLLADFQDTYINISPFFIFERADGTQFDKAEYDEVLFQFNDQSNQERNLNKPTITTVTANKIRSRINRVKEVKRVQFTCPLEIGPGVIISVKGFAIYTHEKVSLSSSSIKVVNEGDQYLMVNGANVLMDEFTGSEISSESKSMKAYKVGSDLIPLTADQMLKIKEYGEPEKPMLRIIGFREMHHYLRHYNVQRSTFISADNRGSYTHSQRTLSALFQAMQKTGKYAVVWGFSRANSSPGIYALFCTSLVGPNFPEGFFLSRLPFRDDIRQLPPTIKAETSTDKDMELVRNYEEILKRFYMRNGYIPQEYENPAIQWHYKMVRDEFCQQELEPGALTDSNEIKQSILNEFDNTKTKIGNLRRAILASAERSSTDSDRQPVSELIKILNSKLNKLNIDDGGNIPPPKKTKAIQDPELTDLDILTAYKADKLSTFKVAQLRKYMTDRRIPNVTSGGTTKKDLIESINEFLSTKNIKI